MPLKCLIIAAGQGSRIRDLGNSKPLVPVLGVPLIERVIRSAMEAGIREFYVVTGYHGEQVREFLDNLAERCPIKIIHIVNEAWTQENGLSVLKARPYLKTPFVLLMGDHLFDPAILRELVAQPLQEGEIILAVDRHLTNPLVNLDDVTRVRCQNGKIVDIGKGLPAYDGFDTGIFYCTPALFDALAHCIQDHQDTTLSAAIHELAQQGKVRSFEIQGKFWLDVDDATALAQAEKVLLAQLADKPNDGPISRHINRPISTRITRHLVNTSLTPNQISLISFALCLVGAGLMAAGGYLVMALGGLLAQLASILDGCDGEIARLKFLKSEFGGWFDAVLDRYADAFLLLGLTWHAYTQTNTDHPLWIGFLAIIGSFMLSYTADKYDQLMRQRIEAGAGRSLRIGRDIRIFLIFLGAILNQPLPILGLIAILMNGEVIRRILVCREAGPVAAHARQSAVAKTTINPIYDNSP